MTEEKRKKITVMGGGTGTFTVLTGLKKYSHLDLSVIVSMMDDGGSNRIIRDEFGLLPTSDIRQCIVALSEEKPKEILRQLFTYRFSAGTGISGMTFGNLFMAALTDIYKSQMVAIDKTCEFLDVKGNIIPVTYDKTNLVALYDNGKQVLGEHDIDEPPEDLSKHKILKLSVFPKAKANPKAVKAISISDAVILGPGDLYTSILPNLVISGVAKSVLKTKAKLVYVVNLMTRYGQISNFKVSDYLKEIKKYSGKYPDYILVNNGKIPTKAIGWYKKVNSEPVRDDLISSNKYKIIRDDFVHKKIFKKSKSDILTRSLVRHDPEKLAQAIVGLL